MPSRRWNPRISVWDARSSPQKRNKTSPKRPPLPDFYVGEIVDFFSSTRQEFQEGIVFEKGRGDTLAIRAHGTTYVLRADSPLIRRRPAAKQQAGVNGDLEPMLLEGELVQIYSGSKKKYFEGQVAQVSPKGDITVQYGKNMKVVPQGLQASLIITNPVYAIILVRIPPGAFPGTILRVKTLNGKWLRVTMPAGAELEPGGTFRYKVFRDLLKASPRFATLLEAFRHCDPVHSGFVTDHDLFAQVAADLVHDNEAGDLQLVWSQLDRDGNGQVSFPEFVEWAESNHVELPTGIPGDRGPCGLLTFPQTWIGPRDDPMYSQRLEITDDEHISELQALLDVSYKDVWTRDRLHTGKTEVPSGFKLRREFRAESHKQWRGYFLKRHLLRHAINDVEGFVEHEARTGKLPQLHRRHGLRPSCNEWLLFHGTSYQKLEAILQNDFSMSFAGSSTGTLYGRGTYLADSITKADEYSEVGPDGLCCVLVCRVLGGHVLYNDEVTPDAMRLERRVLDGGFHSILGDRERCKNTYKEFVVFDADQIYVEYALFYTREYN